MNKSFARSDEGKQVVTTEGDVIGAVMSIEGGSVYIRPTQKLLAGYGSWIASQWGSGGLYELDKALVQAITANSIIVDPTIESPSKMRHVVTE